MLQSSIYRVTGDEQTYHLTNIFAIRDLDTVSSRWPTREWPSAPGFSDCNLILRHAFKIRTKNAFILY